MDNPLPFLKKDEKQWTIDDFVVGDFLGKGKFGLVYKATNKDSQCEVGLKILSKEAIKSYNMVKQLRREIEIHSRLKHKHILNMYGYFHDKNYVYVVLEYADNGSIFKKLVQEKNFDETLIAKYLFQLISAIGYLQARKVIHRDLKLENILIDKDDNLKVCDFGWAVHNVSNTRNTICGTIDYLAPEIVDEKEYDEAVDVWCLGILMYEMLYGFPPFHSKKKEETFERIRNQQLVFHDEIKIISDDAKDLLTKLLGFETEKRCKIDEAIKHNFFAKNLGQWYQDLIRENPEDSNN